MEKFWPGPLTIIFLKREIVPDIVTAGLETVAVRMSAHPIFREVVRKLNRPLAAPSANRFGRISPTTAQHVCDELSGRIPLIVDGGATEHGIESTIVQVENGMIGVLRRGPITDDMLRPFGEVREQTSSATISAPGQLPTHYAPRTKLIVVDDLKNFSPPAEKRIGALCLRPVAGGVYPGLPRPATAATKAPADFATMRYLSNEAIYTKPRRISFACCANWTRKISTLLWPNVCRRRGLAPQLTIDCDARRRISRHPILLAAPCY
jgi:hypothetical protein